MSLECAFTLCNQCMLYPESKKIRSLTIDLAPSNFHLCKHCFRIRWLWPTLKSHSSLPLSSSKSASTVNYKKRVLAREAFANWPLSLVLCLPLSPSIDAQQQQYHHQWHHHHHYHHQCMATVHCALQWRPHTYIVNFKKGFSCETLSATQPPIQSINWCSTKEASSSMATVAYPTSSSSTMKKGSAVKLLLTA